jgi:beta-galactosidase
MHTLKLSLITAFICLLGATSNLAASSDGRQLINLSSGWKFLGADSATAQDPATDDATWQGIDLPHTWNGLDGQDGGDNYRRGAGWYRRHLVVDGSLSG